MGSVSFYTFTAFSGTLSAFLTVFIVVLPGLHSCLNNEPKGQGQGVGQEIGKQKRTMASTPLENQIVKFAPL